MYAFAYHRPKSLADAVSLLKGKPDGRAHGGRQTLIPTLKLRLAKPSDVVDLGGIEELAGIKVEGNNVVIGAHDPPCRRRDARPTSRRRSRRWPISPGHIGDPQVRNRGTIGGSIANNDPAADYPAAVLALNATVTTNKRKIAADDFFKGLFETALERRRAHHRGQLPQGREGRLREVPQPGLALRDGRRVRRQDRRRRARRGDRRGPVRVPRQGDGGRAGQELLARTRSRTSRSRPTG